MTSLFDRYLQESDAFQIKNKSPELNRSQRMLKFFLIFVNVIFLIFACVLMGVGSVALNHSVGPLAGATIPKGIIALGVFIMFLSFFGCAGSWKENRVLLGCYFFFLLLFTLLLLAVGIGVYSQREQAGWYIDQGWKKASPDVRQTFENSFACCGLNTWNDSFAYWPCPNPDPPLLPNQSASEVQPACYDLLVDAFNKSFSTLGGVGVGFALFMLFAMVFVCILIRGIRKKAEQAGDNEKIDAGDDSAAPTSTPDPAQPQP